MLLGCGGHAVQPEDTHLPDDKVDITPWSDHFGGPITHDQPLGREAIVWRDISSRMSISCAYDPRLARAAHEYASALSADLSVSEYGDLDRLRHVVLKAGVPDYAMEMFVADVDPAGIASLVALMTRSKATWTHCGLAVSTSETGTHVVLIRINHIVALSPFPTRVARGSEIRLVGKIGDRRVATVSPYIGHPQGDISRLPDVPVRPSGQFQMHIFLKDPGRTEVELLVDRGRGPEPAVLVPIFVDTEPDPRPIVAPSGIAENDHLSPNVSLYRFLNTARIRMRLTPLKRDSRLDAVAEAHNLEMIDRRFFGHISPYRGTLRERLKQNNLSPAASAENIARSHSILRIHRNLMASPSHRIHLLDASFTHVGLDVARDGDEWVATQVFARW